MSCRKGTHPAQYKQGDGIKKPEAVKKKVEGKTEGGWTPPAPGPKTGAKKVEFQVGAADPNEKPLAISCVTCNNRFETLRSVWEDRGLHVPKNCPSCITARKKREQEKAVLLVDESDGEEDEDVLVVEEEEEESAELVHGERLLVAVAQCHNL